MEKQLADEMIEAYFQKIYGFAMKKAFSYEEAEELCAEMVKEVYLAFLKKTDIENVEGYVWRICENVFAKYVAHQKKKQGVSLDGMILPYYDEYDLGQSEEELHRLRREIAFLTEKRRKAVYSFYYEGKSVSRIAKEMGLPEGTVKWHLNKARNDLKEGFEMERKTGTLGIAPIEALSIGHSGNPGKCGGPDRFLQDKLNLNIVYSVYWTPRTIEEIAEELGMTPVFLTERVQLLEANGFLVKTAGGKYTTYVKFFPREVSVESGENILKVKLQIVQEIAEKYVPKVRQALADVTDVYIPSGNRELFEAALIFQAVCEKCWFPIQRDLTNYRIRTPDGGDYTAFVNCGVGISDPEYVPTLPQDDRDYEVCGVMTRESEKYPCVGSWSADTRYCSREGAWRNNLTEDYEYLYEWICGTISDTPSNAEKFERLRKRNFLTEENRVNIMVVKEDPDRLFARIPEWDEEVRTRFADYVLEQAMQTAKYYPPQMQDLVVYEFVRSFISPSEALRVLDRLYDNKTFRPLTEQERVTSQLLMFCDRLPE